MHLENSPLLSLKIEVRSIRDDIQVPESFSRFQLPSLQRLSIIGSVSATWTSMLNRLTHLELQEVDMTGDELLKYLRNNPDLQVLLLSDLSLGSSDSPTPPDDVYLPNLKICSISYESSEDRDDVKAFLQKVRMNEEAKVYVWSICDRDAFHETLLMAVPRPTAAILLKENLLLSFGESSPVDNAVIDTKDSLQIYTSSKPDPLASTAFCLVPDGCAPHLRSLTLGLAETIDHCPAIVRTISLRIGARWTCQAASTRFCGPLDISTLAATGLLSVSRFH
jgi:hypothetical protein